MNSKSKSVGRILKHPFWRVIELLAVIFALIAFQMDLDDRADDRINNAWQLLYLSTGKGGEGMKDAMEFLKREKKSFQGMDFSGSYLHGVDLRGADLRKASFYDANLFGADLSGAQTNGADFRSAILYQVKGLETLEVENFRCWDTATSWPLDYKPPAPKKSCGQ